MKPKKKSKMTLLTTENDFLEIMKKLAVKIETENWTNKNQGKTKTWYE